MKFTLAYSLMFIYVIAAIVFWGYSLNKQNRIIYQLEQEKIGLLREEGKLSDFDNEMKKIEANKQRRTKQYLGEGSTFILIILLTAGIVYYAYYRQRALARLQKNFMLSITHELKTPIAGIKLNMQTLQKRVLDEAVKQKLLQSSVMETDRLNDLCNNILVSTQLESTRKAIYNDEVNLSDVLTETVNELQLRYATHHFQTEMDSDATLIKGDASLWKLVISNLLENARKYSPAGSTVLAVLQPKAGKWILSVQDEGIGIPEDEKEKIFEKFYRVGNENLRSSKGTGLGLYIVKKIVSLYKYDIRVRNKKPKGSIFEIEFS
jgi:K+-sensing histidine kinase KdpD